MNNKRFYKLTDGSEIFEYRWMDSDELREARIHADEATGENICWELVDISTIAWRLKQFEFAARAGHHDCVSKYYEQYPELAIQFDCVVERLRWEHIRRECEL